MDELPRWWQKVEMDSQLAVQLTTNKITAAALFSNLSKSHMHPKDVLIIIPFAFKTRLNTKENILKEGSRLLTDLFCNGLKQTLHIQTNILTQSEAFSIPASSMQGRRGAGAYLQWSTGKRRVHPGQVASPSQGNTETQRENNHAHTHLHLRAIEKDQIT
ncbi:hypothetical protein ILYODFUR_032619 [Ilyodon furcidens]|uniref:Uncharacterized protein n=1 Tax=Ilyodon furcidens TaxID=33524 RepID=A0ABV0V817_9TELE